MRENDEWKRKEKSGENREIHCSTAATRAYTYIYIGKDRENIHIYYRIYYVIEERNNK